MTDTDFIERFEAFARSKPAGEVYEPWSASSCALAQFGFRVCRGTAEIRGVPIAAYDAAVTNADDVEPTTFGALADRLAKLREAAAKAREQSA